MKIQWLYYFSVLADALNLSDAAKSLDINAKTLQNNIRQLEHTLGSHLFAHQYTHLTEAGTHFKTQALNLLISLEKINAIAQEPYASEIKIGWSDLCGSTLLSPLISQLENTHNHIRVQSFNRNWPLLLNALNSKFINIALTTFSVNGHPVLPLPWDSSFDVYLGEDIHYEIVSHPKNIGKSWESLQFLEYNSSLHMQSPIPFWNDEAYPRKMKISSPNINILKKLCQEKDHAAYLPHSLTQTEQEMGLLAVIDSPPKSHIITPCLIFNQESTSILNVQSICHSLNFRQATHVRY